MSRHFPPGPRSWFFGLGQLRRLNADLLGYYTNLQRTYGDSVSARLAPYRVFVFFHPDQIREVLVTKARAFHKMATVRKVLSKLDGDGLVLSEGDKWLPAPSRPARLSSQTLRPLRRGHGPA